MSQQQTVLRVLTNVPGNISGSTVWDDITTYSQFQIVLFNGLSFVSLQNNNTGNIPNLEPTLYWQQVSNYEFLDLYTDIPIKINKSFAELQDISKKNTDYTIGLTIPGSKKNNKFFESFYNVDTQSLYFNANQRNQCDVLLGDEPLFRGYLKLNKVSVMNSKIEYDVTLYSTVSNLFGAIGNNLLKDLPFEDDEFKFNHEFNLSNVTQEFNFSNFQRDSEYPYPYIYPVVHSGYEYTGYTVNQSGTPINTQTRLYTSTANSSGQLDSYTTPANAWAAGVKQYQINSPTQGLMDNQLKPALNIWSLIKLMFKNYGYTIKSDFFNTPWIKNLYMYGYFASDGTKFSYKITSIQNLPVQGIEISYFQPDNKTIQIFVMKRNSGVPVYCLQDIRVFLTIRVGSITITNVPYTVPAGTSGTTIGNGTDNYTFIRGFSPQAPNGAKIQYTPKPIGTTVSYVDGDYVNFSNVLDPNIKQIDLLSSIAKKFNLIFISNPDVPNEIQIEPYDFYVGTGNIYDWTDKISYDKGFSVEPALNYVESDLTLTDLEDNDDGNKQYKDRNRLIYGQNNVYNPTNFKSQEKKIETIFGPELVRQWDTATQSGKIGLPLGINYAVTNQSDEEGQVRWLYKGLRTKPKLVYWLGGMNPFLDTVNETYAKNSYPTYNVYVSDSAASFYFTSDKLPAISNTMPIGLADEYKINNDTLSILFNSEETVDLTSVVRTYDTYTNFDAYNRFYNNRIRNIYNPNTRFLNGYFDLKYSDVKNLKANDIIKVQEQYFTWNKISEFNLTQRELTKCELIQLNVNPQTYPDRYFFYYYCDNPSTIFKFKTDFTNPNMLDSNYQWSIYYDRQVGSLTGSTSGFTALFKYIQSFSTVVYTPYTMYEVDETTYNASGITWTYDTLRNYIWDTGGAFSSFNMPTFWDNSGTTRTGVNVFESCANFNTIKNTWGILTGSSTYYGVTPTPTPTITPTPTPVPTDDLRVRGSLIITYNEETDALGGDYFYVKINGEYRDLQYTDATELYSTYIYTGDTIEVCVVTPTGSTYYDVTRRDYTIDDVNGNNGIVDTYITGWTGVSSIDPCGTNWIPVATRLPNSYNFEYRIDCGARYEPPTPAFPQLLFWLETTSTDNDWSPNYIGKSGNPLQWSVTGASTNYYTGNTPTFDWSSSPGTKYVNVYATDNFNTLNEINFSKIFGGLEITKINVSKCNNLQYLNLTNNLLKDVDISNNNVLHTVSLGSNQISGLTLNTTSLDFLDVRYNSLPYISTTGNTNLRFLYGSYNPATYINVGSNVIIEEFYMDHMSNLTGLTLTGQTVMNDIYVNHSPNLTYLNIENTFSNSNGNHRLLSADYCTKLTNVNLKNCEKLVTIGLNDCDIQNYDFTNCYTAEFLSISSSQNLTNLNTTPLTSLVTLFAEKCPLTALTMSSIDTLYLSENNFVNLDLRGYTTLQHLQVNKCNLLTNINISGCTNLYRFDFKQNTLIKNLDVSGANILTELYADFNTNLSGITFNNSLSYVQLGSCNFSTINISGLTSLYSLYLYSNKLTSLDTSNNPLLSTLWIEGNDITSLDVSNNPLLIYLNFRSNNISSAIMNNILDDLIVFNQPGLFFDSRSQTPYAAPDPAKATALDAIWNTVLYDLPPTPTATPTPTPTATPTPTPTATPTPTPTATPTPTPTPTPSPRTFAFSRELGLAANCPTCSGGATGTYEYKIDSGAWTNATGTITLNFLSTLYIRYTNTSGNTNKFKWNIKDAAGNILPTYCYVDNFYTNGEVFNQQITYLSSLDPDIYRFVVTTCRSTCVAGGSNPNLGC